MAWQLRNSMRPHLCAIPDSKLCLIAFLCLLWLQVNDYDLDDLTNDDDARQTMFAALEKALADNLVSKQTIECDLHP